MRKLLLAVATLAVLGCGSDSTGPIASVAGTWNLQTINGSPMPFTVLFTASPLYRLEILGDSFVANANGTYIETASVRETDGSTVTTSTATDVGTWVQNNNAIALTASDGTVSSAAISGDIITANESGDVFIYRRQ